MKVGIRQLKSQLSSYLREIRQGATILVYDRDELVAEIHRPQEAGENSVLRSLAAAGEVTLPSARKEEIGSSPVRVQAEIVQDLIDAGRAE